MSRAQVRSVFTLEELDVLSRADILWYDHMTGLGTLVKQCSPCHDVDSPLADHDHDSSHPCYGKDYYRSTTDERICSVEWIDDKWDRIATIDLDSYFGIPNTNSGDN